MEQISRSLNQRPIETIVTTGFNEVKPIGTTVRQKNIKLSQTEVKACDIGLSDYNELMSPEFYAWYCKAWYILGRAKFDLLASMARADGKDKKRLFSHLLKAELKKAVDNN